MSRTCAHLTVQVVTACLVAATMAAQGQWSIEKAKRWYEDVPWLVGCNYLPANASNQLEMWQEDSFGLEVIDRELGWAQGVGINTLRVFLHDMLWADDAAGFAERIGRFLDVAEWHNIRIMFVLFDACWNPEPQLGPQPQPRPGIHNSRWVQSPHLDDLKNDKRLDRLRAYVQGVLGRFGNDPRVAIWDLYNEPGNDNAISYGSRDLPNKQKRARSLVLLKKAFAWAREVNPSQPLTVSVWSGEDWHPNGDLLPINRFSLEHSDIISFHSYAEPDHVKKGVACLRKWQRPIICTEYLHRARRNDFANLLPFFKHQNVGAYHWGLVAGRSQTNYPWESWQNPLETEPAPWQHDLLRPNGAAYDPAEIALIRLLTAAADSSRDWSKVPGTVIHHSPAESGQYIGSPGILILPNGDYLSKCDLFGPKTTEWERAVTLVFKSRNRGESWRQTARINGLFWASVFVHRDNVYLLGTHRHHGNTVILRSADQGLNWSSATGLDNGLLLEGEYHTAPVPVVTHNGRIWRAMEDAMGGNRWGERYRAFMMSAPIGADLLRANNWTLSNRLARNPDWLDGRFGGWLEGNAVVTPEGRMVNILRVDDPKVGGQAALIGISDDGKKATFDPLAGFIRFPGANTKFTIRYDPVSQAYWSLSNYAPPRYEGRNKARTRNTLALIRSKNLKSWDIRSILLFHPEPEKHGFQYPDWQFDGNDIIAAIRTAYDDDRGGAHNFHDANYLTFHRFKNFRNLTMRDAVPMVEQLPVIPRSNKSTLSPGQAAAAIAVELRGQ